MNVAGRAWTVSAVGCGGMLGERYYWLTDAAGDVAMMPAEVVERTDPEQEVRAA